MSSKAQEVALDRLLDNIETFTKATLMSDM